jgi:Uma2 family endonuclease
VEILSDSDRRQVIESKLGDYRKVGVLEAWIVDPHEKTVAVLRLGKQGDEVAAVYRGEEHVCSHVLTELELAAEDVFA